MSSKFLYPVLFLLISSASFAAQLKPGDTFPAMTIKNIHGADVIIPDPKKKWVHLQFRRFAGCPICNLHMHALMKRMPEIEKAGIREVVVFHSSVTALLPYQGKFPFDVIGDPEKKLYQQFGVETSVLAILHPMAWPAMVRGITARDKPEGNPDGGALGLPAEFLISSDGKVVASHYGRHAADQWSVDDLLSLAK